MDIEVGSKVRIKNFITAVNEVDFKSRKTLVRLEFDMLYVPEMVLCIGKVGTVERVCDDRAEVFADVEVDGLTWTYLVEHLEEVGN